MSYKTAWYIDRHGNKSILSTLTEQAENGWQVYVRDEIIDALPKKPNPHHEASILFLTLTYILSPDDFQRHNANYYYEIHILEGNEQVYNLQHIVARYSTDGEHIKLIYRSPFDETDYSKLVLEGGFSKGAYPIRYHPYGDCPQERTVEPGEVEVNISPQYHHNLFGEKNCPYLAEQDSHRLEIHIGNEWIQCEKVELPGRVISIESLGDGGNCDQSGRFRKGTEC